MYQCRIQFYLVGGQSDVFELIRQIPPLENFTHTFLTGSGPEADLAAQADVIVADLEESDARQMAGRLAAAKKAGAQLIVLAGQKLAAELAELSLAIEDIWTLPMTEAEVRFRFHKWQRDYKKEKDLWQASSFLDAAIDGSPNLIWFKDRDGVHEKVNRSFCQTVDKPRQQVEGQCHAYIWDVEGEDPACTESDQEVMRRRETCVSDEIVQTGDGERMLTTYKSPLYDIDGSVMGTVGVAIDVTRERNYEQRLIEKSRTLEMLFSTTDCGVMCHSVDGREVISVNQAALRLLGYDSKEELLADGFEMIAQSVLAEDKESLRNCIRNLQQVGDSASAEYRVRHRDGKILHILGNIKLIEESGIQYYQRFLVDFTDQKLREEEKWAQKDQEIKYQERIFEIFSDFLADNVDDIYMMLDAAGENIEFVSRNLERVLGMSWEGTENLLGQLGKVRYLTGERPDRTALADLQPGMILGPMETERIHRKTGEHKWFQESVYCVPIQNIKKIIVYISDRTKERKTQDALTDALEIANVANRAKSAFLSNVSHDIRTPMNAIMGMIVLLREEADHPERVLEYTQKISAASQHLLGLINDVLDMNKIESGSAVLNISELNLAEIIDELNTIIRPQTRIKDQTFEIFASHLTCEHLLGDKLRINQILINILSNAVKYTPNGGHVEMRVQELPQVAPNYSRIRFTISDDGQGMSEEYQRRLFDPFTRELDTGVNQVQGTGLGMAITKRLVDLMNGTITVESKLDEGSTFVVELELRIQEKEEDPQFWERCGISHMLVADDDEEICQEILKQMAKTGVDTEYAISGARAVEMIQRARETGRPYDLILMDWKMPGLSGLDTARQVRKNCMLKVPILLFTAYDWDDIEQEAMEVGIDHFLPKPFFMSNFKDTLERMVTPEDPKPAANKKSVVDGKRILVVDDIEINRMILMRILGSLGAVCDTAENGAVAVEKFTAAEPEEYYDIVLMDIQMPVMNGHDAARTIRSSGHPAAQKAAILAMTANAFVDDIRSALDAGMDAHVSKPIVLDQLTGAIQEVLDRKAGVQEKK